MSCAIRVEGLSKRYQLGMTHSGTVGELANRVMRRILRRPEPPTRARPTHGIPKESLDAEGNFWALRDVSFEVQPGEVIGLIGKNGAGKSTLLKILSQITSPTSGQAVMNGRVASLLEVGTGFHHELSGRENVFLNGALLGLSKAEIRKKLDEIVAFAEVADFLDTPVKRYSSGMYVRLAFAVAAHLEPEILILDEVLAVGDAAFQKKCLGKMSDVALEGRTVLFVSHNMAAINRLCTRCIWLANGTTRASGATSEVVQQYLSQELHTLDSAEVHIAEDATKKCQLRSIRLLNKADQLTTKFECDEPVRIELSVQVKTRLRGLYGYLRIAAADGTAVLVSDSIDCGKNQFDNLEPGLHVCCLEIPARSLGHGTYSIHVSFASPVADHHGVDNGGTYCQFTLDDTSTDRGNRRQGFFSTLLPWNVRPAASLVSCNGERIH